MIVGMTHSHRDCYCKKVKHRGVMTGVGSWKGAGTPPLLGKPQTSRREKNIVRQGHRKAFSGLDKLVARTPGTTRK